MKSTLLSILILVPMLVFAGGPKVKDISISKSEMKPGETVSITVKLKGKATGVKSMELIVREFPYDVPPYVLKSVDEKKNRTWEAKIPVPYEAPPGNFHLELKITLEDGTQLVTDGSSGNSHGKAATVPVTVI